MFGQSSANTKTPVHCIPLWIPLKDTSKLNWRIVKINKFLIVSVEKWYKMKSKSEHNKKAGKAEIMGNELLQFDILLKVVTWKGEGVSMVKIYGDDRIWPVVLQFLLSNMAFSKSGKWLKMEFDGYYYNFLLIY